ncbi:hypothetical protein WN55_10407 [Dufourea novaeangliae]|uniref:Uncharacterized protein n=1 Tax=Dufourea novaeangliae TaxID=178035 RepID=A0A154P3K5_DUFNO|nr:hypothetical protein WN55_10407 [Dufourea novaeangliae]
MERPRGTKKKRKKNTKETSPEDTRIARGVWFEQGQFHRRRKATTGIKRARVPAAERKQEGDIENRE